MTRGDAAWGAAVVVSLLLVAAVAPLLPLFWLAGRLDP